MLSSNTADTPNNDAIENLLAAHADALLRKPAVQQEDFDFLLDEYGLSTDQSGEVDQLLSIAHRLSNALSPIEPSEQFMHRLQNELIGRQEMTLLLRWRKLPPLYRVAASLGGLTLTAGILLLTARQAGEVVSALHRRQQVKTGLNTAS